MSERFKVVLGCLNLVLNEKNEVLLLLRKNKFDAGLYSLPGGCAEPMESIKTTAVREIKEETNLDVQAKDVYIVTAMYRNMPSWQAVEVVTVVKTFSGDLKNREPEKCAELAWFDLEKLPENMSAYALNAINNYKNGIVFNEVTY